MKRFHIAVAVENLDASIVDYTARLGAAPVLVVPGDYALWRTDTLNVSIRVMPDNAGCVRHVGWEDSQANTVAVEQDLNGLIWERFSAHGQAMEIKARWPDVDYDPQN